MRDKSVRVGGDEPKGTLLARATAATLQDHGRGVHIPRRVPPLFRGDQTSAVREFVYVARGCAPI